MKNKDESPPPVAEIVEKDKSFKATKEAIEEMERFIATTDWEYIVAELTRYTLNKMRRNIWRGEWSGNVPGGDEAADFVSKALEKFLTDPFKYDLKENDLLSYLIQFIKNALWNKSQSFENRFTSRIREFEDNGEHSVVENLIVSKDTSPDEYSLEKREMSRILKKLNDLGATEISLRIAALIMCNESSGIFRPADAAQILDIDIKEVRNSWKQLKRILLKFNSSANSKSVAPTPESMYRTVNLNG